MTKEKKTRVGIVGAGYVSRYHIRAIQSLDFGEVAGIADRNRELASRAAAEFGIPGVFGDLGEMAGLDLDVIHVLTPPDTHCRLTLQALEMGCHVLVEKPMAETAADCRRMIEAARELDLVLSVNHSARMDPVVLTALERIKGNAVGEVLAVDIFRSSDYPPYPGGPMPPAYRKGSYPFQDLGVHALYLLEAFLGKIGRVDANYYSSGRDINLIFDEWRVRADCERGVGQVYLSWNARPMQNVLWVHGTGGVMKVDCFLQQCLIYRNWPGPKPVGVILNGTGASLQTLATVASTVLRFATGKLKPSPGIFTSVIEFHRALQAKAAPPVPAEEGMRAVGWTEEVSLRADRDRAERAVIPILPEAKVLITGAGGFLGRVLLGRLRETGERVRVLLRRPSADVVLDDGVHALYGDLGNPEVVDRAVEGVEVVYHAGAAMRGSAADFERGTVAGTRNVVEACLKHKVRRLVYVSSLSVLDHAGADRRAAVTESAAYEPHPELRGAYTQSKLEAERIVLQAASDRGLPAVVLRPGQIIGPGGNPAPSGVIGLAGRWVVVGTDRFPLPLIYVDDVVEALLKAATAAGVTGRIFHLVDPERVELREYLALARQTQPRQVHVPSWGMYLMSFLVEQLGKILKRGVPLTRYRLRSLRPLERLAIQRAVDGLGWRPVVGVREGLRRTFAADTESPAGSAAGAS